MLWLLFVPQPMLAITVFQWWILFRSRTLCTRSHWNSIPRAQGGVLNNPYHSSASKECLITEILYSGFLQGIPWLHTNNHYHCIHCFHVNRNTSESPIAIVFCSPPLSAHCSLLTKSTQVMHSIVSTKCTWSVCQWCIVCPLREGFHA